MHAVKPRDDGQHLDPQFLLLAYSRGYFPMAESRTGPIRWYSPNPRAIIPLDAFHISRSLKRSVEQSSLTITVNTAFPEVIRACAERADTWISDEIIAGYTELHRAGDAHSVEVWRQRTLVGGLYGVAIAGAFFGESMFSRETNASKIALVHLVQRLHERKFALLDTQLMNPHIQQFGAVEIDRAEYLAMLEKALKANTSFL